MKIGILTYHCVPNYGAQLQAISTVGYLKRRGYTPIVLHWYPSSLENNYIGRIPDVQIDCHRQFTEGILPISRIIRTQSELIEIVEELGTEYILVGSDALFKYTPKVTQRYFSKRKLKFIQTKSYTALPPKENPFFGGFISHFGGKVGASAFSVSSQNCPYSKMNQNEIQEMAECLSNFKKITVRDEWTKSMVKAITEREEVLLSPDPVFSFEQNRWFELPSRYEIMNKFNLKDNYILFSFSNNFQSTSYVKSLEDAFKSVGLNPVALPMPEGCFDFGISSKIDLPLSPIDWYALIKYSCGYVGERMHPIVVSIHNSVPFFCFDEYGTTKSSCFGLKKRFVLESSKTFHIINKAGLDEQMCSYRIGRIPEPNSVVDAIIRFNKEKCANFSSYYQKQFEYTMNTILE